MKIQAEGIKRRRVGYVISDPSIPASQHSVEVLDANGNAVGILSEWVYSERFGSNIGVGMIGTEIKENAEDLSIRWDGQSQPVQIKELPFI